MNDENTRPLQTWSAEGYERNARFVSDLAQEVVELLLPRSGERILDLGCGDGILTARIAESGASVLGIDSSLELLTAARTRGLNVQEMDARKLTFASEFDAVFSNAVLHWIPDAQAVVGGVMRALKPGGRFIGEFGGHGNVAAISTAVIAVLNAHGVDGAARFPWYFPTPDEYSALLKKNGFEVVSMRLLPRPTSLPTGMRGWLETFSNPFLKGFEGEAKSQLLDEITKLLSTSLCDTTGNWTADYVRLRFEARLI